MGKCDFWQVIEGQVCRVFITFELFTQLHVEYIHYEEDEQNSLS